MTSPIEQTAVNSFHHAALVSGFAIGYGHQRPGAEARFDGTQLRDAFWLRWHGHNHQGSAH